MADRELVAGMLRMLILNELSRGPGYGYGIAKGIERRSGGDLAIRPESLYPVLHRLEKQKLIVSEKRQGESGRMRKYYRIKKEGKQAIVEYKQQWAAVYATLKQVWEVKPCLS